MLNVTTGAAVWTYDNTGKVRRLGTVERSGPDGFYVRWQDTAELQRFVQAFFGIGVFPIEPDDWRPITGSAPKIGAVVWLRTSKRPDYGEHCMRRTSRSTWRGRSFGLLGAASTTWDPAVEQPDQFRPVSLLRRIL